MLDVAVVQPPAVVHPLERLSRKNRGGAVADAHARARERHLHDESCVLARGVSLALVRRGDAERRRVIVGTE